MSWDFQGLNWSFGMFEISIDRLNCKNQLVTCAFYTTRKENCMCAWPKYLIRVQVLYMRLEQLHSSKYNDRQTDKPHQDVQR